jgi:hypothetical protein
MFQSYKFRSKIGVQMKNRPIGIDYAKKMSDNAGEHKIEAEPLSLSGNPLYGLGQYFAFVLILDSIVFCYFRTASSLSLDK